MKDPRESKLPKWAQEALEAERVRTALAWPTVAKPTPLWAPGPNTYAPPEYDGAEVYMAYGGTAWGAGVKKCTVKGRFIARDGGTTHRPEDTPFFATEREAWEFVWWEQAEDAAARLHNIRQKAEGAA